MPLSEKARIEVYVPDLPRQSYRDLLHALDQEFTYTFGGCTIIAGLDGSYLSRTGLRIQDKTSVIYADGPLSLNADSQTISRYMDRVRIAADEALEEEAVLVTVQSVYHSQ